MDNYIEQYQAKRGGVTLHIWTEVHGVKKENFYVTGMSGTPVPPWFRAAVRHKGLADIATFPSSPSSFSDSSG
jgi:hypothetical protein